VATLHLFLEYTLLNGILYILTEFHQTEILYTIFIKFNSMTSLWCNCNMFYFLFVSQVVKRTFVQISQILD